MLLMYGLLLNYNGGKTMGKKGVSSKTHTQNQRNHYSNQMNPNSKDYKARMDNHSNQKNQNQKLRNKLSKSEFQVDMWPGFIDD